jgi:hypothetical protein
LRITPGRLGSRCGRCSPSFGGGRVNAFAAARHLALWTRPIPPAATVEMTIPVESAHVEAATAEELLQFAENRLDRLLACQIIIPELSPFVCLGATNAQEHRVPILRRRPDQVNEYGHVAPCEEGHPVVRAVSDRPGVFAREPTPESLSQAQSELVKVRLRHCPAHRLPVRDWRWRRPVVAAHRACGFRYRVCRTRSCGRHPANYSLDDPPVGIRGPLNNFLGTGEFILAHGQEGRARPTSIADSPLAHLDVVGSTARWAWWGRLRTFSG